MTVYARRILLNQVNHVQKPPIEIELWEPNPEKPGYLRFVRMKTYQEVFDELHARLKSENLVPDEYFNICSRYNERPEKMPVPSEYWRVISFAVKGSSEGNYIHVGMLLPGGKYQDLFVGKTLREGVKGLNYAMQIANTCTRAFQS